MMMLRRLRDRRLLLILSWAMCIIAATGCERSNTASQAQIETGEHKEPQAAELVEETPLLLEDEPLLLLDDEGDEEAADDSAADNSRCFVCHLNYAQEQIAVTHAKKGMGCAQCHGPSDAHIADESWASGGNGTAPDIMYPRDKINAACLECHSEAMIDAPHHEQVFMTGDDMKVCTDCHGDHRLPQRRCKWK
jgi:hypothetical protein